ncbi:MAG: 3-hydroxyacyl-CoA dehydrogenase family protein, partial [Pseudomonadota bacterium]
VFEDMDVKKTVFAELDRAMKPGAILASNTSYLDINEIAGATARPEAVIGLHFFSPAHIMKLLEIVVADQTDPDVTATGFKLAKTLRKVAVRSGVCDGFIGNRILARYRQAADYLMLDGASPYEIDDAVRAFGFPMGPYQVADLAGLDIGWATRKRKAPNRDARERYVAILDQICEQGHFGRKTGRGLYRYDQGNPKGVPDDEVLAIIDAERTANAIAPRSFTSDEIVERYMAAMVNEATRVIEEKIALRPSDIDVTLLYGYGFPRFRGGPTLYADLEGPKTILERIESYADEDAFFWQPASLLRDLAASGRTFASLNDD